MKIDSCRHCGSELAVTNNCNGCNQPIQFQCKKCRRLTDKQIYFDCKYSNLKIPIVI